MVINKTITEHPLNLGVVMNILYMGQYYTEDSQSHLLKISKRGISVAHYKLQKNFIEMLKQRGDISLVTVLPVANYPLGCSQLNFQTKDITKNHKELGGLNVPFLKHVIRYKKIKSELDFWYSQVKTVEEKVIFIYDLYLPFLKAAIAIKKKYPDLKIIIIIPDLTGSLSIEYDSFSLLTKIYKNNQSKQLYKLLKKLDGFIVLTEFMIEALSLEDKPYLRIEGVVDSVATLPDFDKKKESFDLLYAGELSHNVGLQDLLSAMAMLRESPYRLHICGRGELETLIKLEAEKNRNLVYHGFLVGQQMKKLENEIDFYINPRKENGKYTKYSFPSKNLEALKQGKPLIAHKLEGIPREYDSVIYYPNDNSVESLRDKILEVASLSITERTEKCNAQLEFMQTKTSISQSHRLFQWLGTEIFNDC